MYDDVKIKKKYGQNFLIDHNIIRKIVCAINPVSDDIIVEIGPGLGALTKEILACTHKITAIEIDPQFIEKLHTNYSSLGELIIINNDILKTDLSTIATSQIRLIGNLPYNISSPILFHILQYKNNIKDCCFMIQKELADRLLAKPSTKTYGRITVMLQYHATIKKMFNIPPTCFNPIPKVISTLLEIKFTPFTNPVINEQHFANLVKLAFNQRRKMLRNSLINYVENKHFEIANINPKLRAENLSVNDYVNLSNTCVKYK